MLSKHGLILSIWIIFFVLTTLSWIFKNNLPPAWDQADYLEASEHLYQSLTDNGILEFFIKTTTVLPRKAPLIAILPIPFYWLFNSSPKSALLVNIVFFALFATFFYLLLKKIWSEKIALTAVFICSTMPLFYGLLRNYLVEFGLMTIVVIWLYVLLKTESFQAKKYLILLGIISGLGMLMKFHFFLFVIGPFFLTLFVGWKKKNLLARDLTKLFYIAIPAFLIAVPWYSRNILTVLWHAKRATNPEILGSAYYGPPFSLRTISLSLTDLVNFAISSYWFLILIILFLLFWIKGKKLSINYLFLSWFIIPFLIFFFGPNKDYRLMLPLLPPIGVFIAWLFWELFSKKGCFYLSFLLILPILIYINTTVVPIPSLSNRISIGPLLFSDQKISGYVVRPKNEYWPIREVLVFLNSLPPQDKTKTVVLASEHESFNINNLRYYTVKEKLNLEVKTASYFPKNSQFETVKSFIENGDYLIMKIGGNPGPARLNIFNDQIEKSLNWQETPNQFIFPDGGRLFVAKKL